MSQYSTTLCCIHVHFYLFQDSTIRRGFGPSFVYYKKGCIRLAAASDKVYQLLVQGRWFSPGTPDTSTTKTGRHDIAEILLKVALNTKIQNSRFQTISKWSLTYVLLFDYMDGLSRRYKKCTNLSRILHQHGCKIFHGLLFSWFLMTDI